VQAQQSQDRQTKDKTIREPAVKQMINKKTMIRVAFVAGVSLVMMFIGVTGVQAATAPIKEIISAHIGREVDKTKKQNICTVKSGDECQFGEIGSEADGFNGPQDVAGAPNGNIYATDEHNSRVQELTATGEFELMFGMGVNKKGGNICTKTEQAECKAGVEGVSAEAFTIPRAIAVDPNGNVYVAEPRLHRVDEYTAGGVFVLMIGKEVNETTHGNLCTEEEIKKTDAKCKAGIASNEQGAFEEPTALAAGPGNILYVGDEYRVQEFEATGAFKEEIPLTSISTEPGANVSAITVDSKNNVYLVYKEANGGSNVVREYEPNGKPINEFSLTPRRTDGTISVLSIAVDPFGRLAISESESAGSLEPVGRGSLYEVGVSLRLITEFPSHRSKSITFNSADELYAAFQSATSLDPANQELIVYNPEPVGELIATTPAECEPGVEHGTDVTLDCSLTGEVDPWGVKETDVWFEWGRSPSFGERTKPQPIKNEKLNEGEEEKLVDVNATIEDVRPNETLYDEMVGEDHNVKAPEELTSLPLSFTTLLVPPKMIGEPQASIIRSSRAVLYGELNPENANTTYRFEYAEEGEACHNLEENCPGRGETTAIKSAAYGKIGTTQEASGLQPNKSYRYRLVGENEHKERSVGQENTFTTVPAPTVQAETGSATATTATSAVVSGTVNPDGQAATYTFELGIDHGAATQYGVVFSGPTGASATPVEETLALTGLQPGTTYAYRITISSGYGTAQGAPMTLTTSGLPAALIAPPSLPMLAIPTVQFPKTQTKPPLAKCKHGYTRNTHGKCVKAKKKNKKAVRKSTTRK
jgi:hypothetical protein